LNASTLYLLTSISFGGFPKPIFGIQVATHPRRAPRSYCQRLARVPWLRLRLVKASRTVIKIAPEASQTNGLKTPVKGEITFKEVGFRYKAEAPHAPDEVTS
jgi:hypothetical protein